MGGVLDVAEEKDIRITENRLLTQRRRYIYIALEELEEAEFLWGRWSLKEFDRLWNEDIPLTEIAETLEKTETACLLLALDRVMLGKLEPRRGWKIW
jgi:hypothetical protein